MILRFLDICAALLGLGLCWPLLIGLGVIGLFDTGSPFFVQTRVGQYNRPFRLIKFRTMRKDTGCVPTHQVDARAITPFGAFLRKSKLDELPQLFNVLLGQMSLVGPRPCLPTQLELIQQRSLRRVDRIKPGITGLAQINAVDMSTPRKLARYDALMLKHLTVKHYCAWIMATVLGQGSGDRVHRPIEPALK